MSNNKRGAGKRVLERDSCQIAAEIVLTGSQARHPCLISDISEGGARLELARSEALPLGFDCLLPAADEIVDRRCIEERWQLGQRTGVRFEQS